MTNTTRAQFPRGPRFVHFSFVSVSVRTPHAAPRPSTVDPTCPCSLTQRHSERPARTHLDVQLCVSRAARKRGRLASRTACRGFTHGLPRLPARSAGPIRPHVRVWARHWMGPAEHGPALRLTESRTASCCRRRPAGGPRPPCRRRRRRRRGPPWALSRSRCPRRRRSRRRPAPRRT